MVEKKLNDYITSYTKLINDLTKEVKLISVERITKYLINIVFLMVQNILLKMDSIII